MAKVEPLGTAVDNSGIAGPLVGLARDSQLMDVCAEEGRTENSQVAAREQTSRRIDRGFMMLGLGCIKEVTDPESGLQKKVKILSEVAQLRCNWGHVRGLRFRCGDVLGSSGLGWTQAPGTCSKLRRNLATCLPPRSCETEVAEGSQGFHIAALQELLLLFPEGSRCVLACDDSGVEGLHEVHHGGVW
jgi:hypothetical protein